MAEKKNLTWGVLTAASIVVPALLFFHYFPVYASRWYADFTDSLIYASLWAGYIFSGGILAIIGIFVAGSIFSGTAKFASFKWRPGESYLARKESFSKEDEDNAAD